jgi:hypothetical protein
MDRLAARAASLRKQAEATPPGVERDKLMLLAKQAEAGSKMIEWLELPGSGPAK